MWKMRHINVSGRVESSSPFIRPPTSAVESDLIIGVASLDKDN